MKADSSNRRLSYLGDFRIRQIFEELADHPYHLS